MDDDDFMEVNLTGLDLNHEPTEQLLPIVTRYGSLSNELVSTAHARIEERIRQVEAVTARDRHRQRWRQSRNSTDISYSVSETSAEVDSRSFIPSNGPTALPGSSTLERAKGCKRDSSHLVAQALAMDAEVQKADNEEGSFYNCSICLDMAREPVLTCCGHLFCWPCFYQVPGVDSDSKQCPVCKGEVSNNTVIPIYGNGGSETICVSESGMPIPPRPKARRVESSRQQRVTQGLSHVLVAEALRRIRTSIGAMGSPIWEEGGEGDPLMRIHQASRVLSESAASLSSLSAALNNAERLVDDLESVVNNRVLRNVTRNIAVRTLLADERRVNAGQPVAQVPPSSSPAAVVRRRNFMVYRDDREARRRRLN